MVIFPIFGQPPSTRKTTYTDSTYTTASSNPVIADGNGCFEEIFLIGTYKIVLTDKNDVVIWTVDPYKSDPLSKNINSIANLSDEYADGDAVIVASFYDVIPNIVPDGGGGPVIWDASANANLHDGGIIFDPNHSVTPGDVGYYNAETGAGVWRRAYERLSALFFGCKINGLTECTEGAKAYIDYCIGNNIDTAWFPAGTYYTTDSLITPARSQPGLNIAGDGRNTKFLHKPASQATPLFDLQGVEKVVFDNFSMIGDYNNPADVFHCGAGTNRSFFQRLFLYPCSGTTDGTNPVFAFKAVAVANWIINTYRDIVIWDQGANARNGAITQSGTGNGVIGWGMDETLGSNVNLHASTWSNIYIEGIDSAFRFPVYTAAQNCKFTGMMFQGMTGSLDIEFNGTSTNISANVLTDTTKSLTINAEAGKFVQISGGSFSGQVRRIVSNTTTALTVDYDFDDTTNALYDVVRNAPFIMKNMINCEVDFYHEILGSTRALGFYLDTCQNSRISGFNDSLNAFVGGSDNTNGNIITGQLHGLYIPANAGRNTVQDLKHSFGLGVGQSGLNYYSGKTNRVNSLHGTSNTFDSDSSPQSKVVFSASKNSSSNNVSGDGTLYTVTFDNEISDPGGNFSSPTFTASQGGQYLLISTLRLSGVTASHTSLNVNFTTSNRDYKRNSQNSINDFADEPTLLYTQIVDMDKNDTAQVQFESSGSTKVIDVIGSAAAIFTSFQAQLLG